MLREHSTAQTMPTRGAVLGGRYEGAKARTYDADRCHSLRWAREQIAVHDFVTQGPVLDVPLGTGRYCEIYRAKGLDVVGLDASPDMLGEASRRYPGIDARLGSILAMPFEDGAFGSAVCTRLLDWLSPADMAKSASELRRVAGHVIVSLRHGTPGYSVNWTHDLSEFLSAMTGLYLAGRRLTEETELGTEEIFYFRPPLFSDVLRQFDHHGHTPAFELQRLGLEWFQRVGDSEKDFTLWAEYWTGPELFAVIAQMSAERDATLPVNETYITDLSPRYEGEAVVLLRQGERTVVLDGRRRINSWRDNPARFQVLLLECR